METATIRARIKQLISDVTGISQEEIADNASFIEDLKLDSLSLLEIGVDVDYAFRLGVAEQRLQGLVTVQDAVDLVVECLTERTQHAEVA